MARVQTNGVALAAREWSGPEPAIVAVHGLTANRVCWESIAETLQPRRRFIAYDLRGRGDSDKPAKGYSLEIHARDLEGLLDHFGLRRAVIMGHSLGAAIGVRAAVDSADRVAGLILVDGGCDLRAEVLESIAPVVERLGVEFPSLDAYLAIMRSLPVFHGVWDEYLTRYFAYDVEPGPGGGVRSKVARHAIEEEVANLARERLWAWHRKIQAPTLVLRAPEGLLTDADCVLSQDEALALAHAIPDCALAVIPGTNHYTILKGAHPALRATLRSFLTRDGSPAAVSPG